jgi:hypothetical protein
MKAGELAAKMKLARSLPRVKGNCFWPAGEILRDNGGIADSLAGNYHRYPALVPALDHLSTRRPARPRRVETRRDATGHALRWEARPERHADRLPRYFVVYAFAPGEKINLDDPSRIKAITTRPACFIPARGTGDAYRVVITAVDRYHNESRGRVVRLDP